MKAFVNVRLPLLIFLAILVDSCGEFGDINIDPNNTTSVQPQTLLTSTLRGTRNIAGSRDGDLYAQHISQTIYTLDSRYAQVNFDFNFWYVNELMNLQEIIRLNSDLETKSDAQISGSNNNQIAVARILKAYIFFHLTDRWGPLPYSEALQGRANFRPSYDSQETIYIELFKQLKESVQQIDGGKPVQGDFLFNGDMERWKQFANSLRLIQALRLSNIAPDIGRGVFADAINNGVLNSNEDNIMYPFLAESDNENPYYSRNEFAPLEAISNVLINRLFELNDPRLYSYADPSENNNDYSGMTYGIDNPSIDPSDVSLPHSVYVRGQDTPLPLLTYSQILFCMSEAAQLGWINNNAEQLYYDAIKASMEQWFAYDQELYETYIEQEEVKWSEENAMQRIGEQKWIALFTQGYEAWAEWRRTGYPELQPAPDALNQSGQIPRRQGYPTSERDINHDNWKFAVDTWLGGEDGLDSKVWWDES